MRVIGMLPFTLPAPPICTATGGGGVSATARIKVSYGCLQNGVRQQVAVTANATSSVVLARPQPLQAIAPGLLAQDRDYQRIFLLHVCSTRKSGAQVGV